MNAPCRRAALLLLAVALALTPFASASSYGSHGTKVATGNADAAPIYATAAALTGAVVCRISAAAAGVLDDYYYLHHAADCTGNVLAGDLRLTTTNGGAAGIPVLGGTADVGTTYTAIVGTTFLAGVGYLEADGLPGYSLGDPLYYSVDATVDSTAGDLRLSTTTNTPSVGTVTTTAGTVVGASTSTEVTEAGDADGNFPESTALLGQGTFVLRYVDLNSDVAFSQISDPIYLTPAAPADHPAIGDLHLTTLNSQTFGTVVSKTSTDYKAYLLTALADANVVLGTTDDTQPATTPQLFAHFVDTVPVSVIQPDDVVMRYTGGSMGTRVTTVATGQTAPIDTSAGAAPEFVDQVFFIDLDGNTRYTPQTDPVYLHRNIALGGTTNTLVVTAGDLRLTAVTVGGSSYAAASVVTTGDADIAGFAASTANGGAGGQWKLALHNVDRTSFVPLTSLTNGKVSGTNFATAGAYISANAVVTNGDLRIYRNLLAGNTAAACVGVPADDPGDADCGTAITADTNLRVSGTDAIYTAGNNECVYYSRDAYVNAGDVRLTACMGLAVNTVVAAGDADTFPRGASTRPALGSTDELYLQWCETGCPTNNQLRPGDLLFTTSGTTRVTSASTGLVPTLTAITEVAGTACNFPGLKRIDVASNGATNDDAFYLSFSAASNGAVGAVRVGDFRLTPYTTTAAAGTQVGSSSPAETTSVTTCENDALVSVRIKYVDSDGVGGFSSGDGVYMDTGPDVGGTVGLNQGDIRLTPVTISGTTYAAGTIVVIGDKDLPGSSYAGTQPTWILYLFDEDRDTAATIGDIVYINPGAATTSLNPSLLAVRLGGGGGSSSSTGGSGGGSTVVTTTTSTTSGSVTSSTSASVTDSSTSGTGTDSGTFTTGTGTDTGTGTGDGDGGGDNSTPGLGFAVLVFALAAAVLVARRKL